MSTTTTTAETLLDGDEPQHLLGGAYSTPGNGPFPVNGLIPALKPLYDYSWVVGLGTGFAVYLVLSLFGRAEKGSQGPAQPV